MSDLEQIIARLAHIERILGESEIAEVGATFVPLTAPLTNPDFDGDSFSDVGSNTIIENTSWSTTIPTNAKALLLNVACRDSGSAGTSNLYIRFYPTSGGTTSSLVCVPGNTANDEYGRETGVVPCTSGDIWYQVNASGAGTMDVYLNCFGYWI